MKIILYLIPVLLTLCGFKQNQKHLSSSVKIYHYLTDVSKKKDTTTTKSDTTGVERPKKTTVLQSNDAGGLTDLAKTDLINLLQVQKMDSLWMEEIYNSALFEKETPVSDDETTELTTQVLKERLAEIDSKTPFRITYNPSLERLIKTFLKTRKKFLLRMMSLSQYYFPLFEEQLDKYNIPLELKYLAIVESALQPTIKSKAAATGLWQFMYHTGKQYGLKINSYVDERSDPQKSTEAACKFMVSLYKVFGDWDLVLAAYNSGPGNVTKAIRRSGGQKNFWDIRYFLPRETQGYLPSFLAMLYIFEYAKEHNLYPARPKLSFYETDTVHVKRQISFKHIGYATGMSIKEIRSLNPSYKLNVIPYVKKQNYSLTLPKDKIGVFVSKETEIYARAAKESERQKTKYYKKGKPIRYRVRNRDYLGKIASHFGVTVKHIKHWNEIRNDRIRAGQYLVIYPKKRNTTARRNNAKIPGAVYYTVKKGDTLWSISKKFPKISIQKIKKWNNIGSVRSLKPGTKLRISKG